MVRSPGADSDSDRGNYITQTTAKRGIVIGRSKQIMGNISPPSNITAKPLLTINL